MGKEWLFWGGGGGSSKSTKKQRSSGGGAEREAAAAAAAPTGCMCAVFQLFDLHHLPFAMHHQPSFKPGSFLQDEPTIRKGHLSSLYLLLIKALSFPSGTFFSQLFVFSGINQIVLTCNQFLQV